MTAEKNIRQYLEHISGLLPDICAEIFCRFLKEEPSNAAQNFQLLLELWPEVDTDQTVEVGKYFSEEEYKETFQSIQPIIGKLVNNLVEENAPADQFYARLWESISNKVLFPSELECICAILYVLASPLTPYYQMEEPIQIDDEKFNAIGEIIKPQVQKAFFALNRKYRKRTEVSSQLIFILENLDNVEQRIVFMAKLIGRYQIREKKLHEKLKEYKKEADASDPT